MELEEKIREIRLVEGYTQKDFATLLRCGETTIRGYEAKRRTPNAEFMENLCKEFPDFAYWLMTDNIEPPNHLSPEVKMQMVPNDTEK